MKCMSKRILTLSFSFCLCLISTLSCGEKKAVIKTEKEDLKPRPKLVEYVPTDEIRNASLSSGLIQIGNDVFRNGGYYTVGQLMKEMEGKYELQGGIDIDGVLVGDEENGIAPGTAFEDLPSDWVCPLCGVGKDDFAKQE